MKASGADWLKAGNGRVPRLSWSLATDAPLVAMRLGRETGEVLAADQSGGLYLIDRSGKIANLTRGRTPIRSLGWSDTGEGGAALVGEDKLYWFDRSLKFQGAIDLPLQSLALAVDPHGQYAAVSLADGGTQVFDVHRKRVRRFETAQPLIALEFLLGEPALLGVAEYGLLCCYSFAGEELWQEKLWANVGDLAVTGDGSSILLACYAYGIQCHDEEGTQVGSYQLGGTVCKVATSFIPGRIAAATLERHFYWLDPSGRVEWQSTLPDDIKSLQCDPRGTGLVCGFQSGRIMRLDWNR